MIELLQRLARADPAILLTVIALYYLLWAVTTIWMMKRGEENWEDTAGLVFNFGFMYVFVLLVFFLIVKIVCEDVLGICRAFDPPTY